VERLKHKVALVTGGAAGLGKGIVERLISEGARVVITDVQQDLGSACAAQFGCEFLLHDVTSEESWQSVIRETQRRCGGLHVLVNNAGIAGTRGGESPEDTSLEDWRRIFAVNVEGVMLGCKVSIPAIHAAGGGSIVNISSVAGLLATPYAMAYGASKATVRHLTKTVAQHCLEKKLKVRCNSVHPGTVRTLLWERTAEQTARKRGVPVETIAQEIEAIIPMGDMTRVEDVSAAVAFLASEEARHVTGEKLVVDGGIIHCDTYRMGFHRR
jgi:3(or 17)beta-hydroxysteroid dehydrogenase